jgi:transposase
MKPLDENIIQIYKETSTTLTGSDRRAFQAKITNEYLEGNPNRAELVFGWGRNTVKLGLKELETGYTCFVEIHNRGDKKTEEKLLDIEKDIKDIAEPYCQVDPKFKTSLRYTRITAKAIRKALIDLKGYTDEELPTERTINNILNRLGYTLKRVLKTKPQKKVKETDAIFKNVHEINKMADEDPETLRISMDSKAKVAIGESSRGGKSRGKKATKACDHDMNSEGKLVTFGILEVVLGILTTVVGNSAETSDFIVDALQIWWDDRKDVHQHIKCIVINLDNGPSSASQRTQFIKRITMFAEANSLDIHLVYYPPYHSKYNPIERCWGALEKHWNGAILDSVNTALEWIKTMTWKNNSPIVHFLDKTYKKGIKLTKDEMKKYYDKIYRSTTLPRWNFAVLGGST